MFTLVTLEWSLSNPTDTQAQPATGGILFQLQDEEGNPVSLTDDGTGDTISALPIQAQILSGVLLSSLPSNPAFQLVANDDPTSKPTGTSYLVTEQFGPGSLPPWSLTVPHTSLTLNYGLARPTPS